MARYIRCINNFNTFRYNLKNLNLLKRDLDYFKKYINDYDLSKIKREEYKQDFLKQKNYFCEYIIYMENLLNFNDNWSSEDWIQIAKYNPIWRKVMNQLCKATKEEDEYGNVLV